MQTSGGGEGSASRAARIVRGAAQAVPMKTLLPGCTNSAACSAVMILSAYPLAFIAAAVAGKQRLLLSVSPLSLRTSSANGQRTCGQDISYRRSRQRGRHPVADSGVGLPRVAEPVPVAAAGRHTHNGPAERDRQMAEPSDGRASILGADRRGNRRDRRVCDSLADQRALVGAVERSGCRTRPCRSASPADAHSAIRLRSNHPVASADRLA